jgi:exodeoxyribonuclease V beta subunit
VTSEAETPGTTDEELDLAGVSTEAAPDGDRARLGRRAPLAAMAGGTRIGTMVHSVPGTPITPPRSPGELRRALADETAGHRPGAAEIASRATAIDPTGSLATISGSATSCADRLDELTFELPIAGGDDPAGQLRVTLADVFEAPPSR